MFIIKNTGTFTVHYLKKIVNFKIECENFKPILIIVDEKMTNDTKQLFELNIKLRNRKVTLISHFQPNEA